MKILFIHTGGTISCITKDGVLTPRSDIAPSIDKMFGDIRGIRLIHKHLPPVLSENTDGRVLNKIISAVRKPVLSGKYGGVIVTAGSDALAYTSAAISYAVGLSKTPCVTVCSDLPLSCASASGNVNLKAAVTVIRSKKAIGALTVYPDADGGVSVYRASRIMQQPLYFSTPVPVGELYGKVKNGEFLLNPKYKEAVDSLSLEKVRFSTLSPVVYWSVYPGMIYPSVPLRAKAVILGSYHSGTLNTESEETAKFAKRCKKRGVRVYVGGIGDGSDYESMKKYGELGFIRLPALSSPHALLIKLWLLNSGLRKFSDAGLLYPLGGDLTEAPSVRTDTDTPSENKTEEGL